MLISLMVSISSSKSIKERAKQFCEGINHWDLSDAKIILIEINDYLSKEYEMIPKKERIGKGIVYISKYVSKGLFSCLKNNKNIKNTFFVEFIQQIFKYGENNDSLIMQHFALLFLSEYVMNYPQNIEKIIPLIQKYANYHDWSIRESTVHVIQSGLKKIPEKTLELLSEWVKNENENLRRIVSECLRPNREIMWLRDPKKNNKVLNILTGLRKDPSIYVRKSVGNNIKDLSKYMPEKMLDLMQQWINLQKSETNFKIHDEIAMEVGLNKEEKLLIWTMKHAMRWIRARKPIFHPYLEKILGKNYILYFDEKRNRLSKPLMRN